MNGWIILGALALLLLAGLVFVGRVPKSLWQIVAATILLGMTGYALQGRPDLPGSPAQPREAKVSTANELLIIRGEMDHIYGPGKRWLVTADAFARAGGYAASAGYIQAGLREFPRDPDLWSGLGLQLMLASDGQMSPPAKMAFDKARSLDKFQPAPDYFQGLADLFEGRVDDTLKRWKALLATARPEDRWKKRLESQIAALEQLAAQNAGAQKQVTPTP